ncbi:cell wall protein DAN4-like [Gigantopelta aegis]|uniref:cell wall protein DAN4-like n=1 Tax=Gigantopelta aegis TaxID=1735272 RepID=UPI001B88A680|nr:cell wall protein DAN4-like [Gigantopelta aegis]
MSSAATANQTNSTTSTAPTPTGSASVASNTTFSTTPSTSASTLSSTVRASNTTTLPTTNTAIPSNKTATTIQNSVTTTPTSNSTLSSVSASTTSTTSNNTVRSNATATSVLPATAHPANATTVTTKTSANSTTPTLSTILTTPTATTSTSGVPVKVTVDNPEVKITMPLLRLKCVVTGEPKPNTTWHKLDGPDIWGNGNNVYNFGDELLFLGVDPGNVLRLSGVYICNATNGVTSAAGYLVVSRLVTASITCTVPFVTHTPGVSIKITCPASCSGTNVVNGTSNQYSPKEPLCPSAIHSGVIDSKGGDVIFVIRNNGKAQFIDTKSGPIVI